jgi:hypothetical protein
VVVVAALFALLPASAYASTETAGGIKYVTDTVHAKPMHTATVTASCPKGTRTMGGGETNSAGYAKILLEQTFPYDDGDKGSKPDDGWRVRLVNAAASRKKVEVTAICGDTKVSYRDDKFNVGPATQSSEKDVSCPADMFALSGGIEAGPKSPVFLNSTFPAGAAAWGSYVDNPGPATKATAHTLCGKREPEVVTTTVNNIQPGAQGGTQPACPADRFPYGGGLDNNGGFEAVGINTLGPTGATGWMGVIDDTGGFPVDLTVYAVCGKRLS